MSHLSRIVLSLMVCLGTSGVALAGKAKEQEKPDAGMFLASYLQCDRLKDPDFVKALAKPDCLQKVNMHFCSLLKELPDDVQRSLSLEVHCNFLGGEQNGDREHDDRILETARAAGCFDGHAPRMALFRKYKDDANVTDALENFTKALMDNEALCYARTTPSAEEGAQ